MEQGIKSRKRVKDFGEVFTPTWLVSDMCDLCEPDISNPEKTVLEPACGNGNFLVEILKRKLNNCHDDNDRLTAVKSLFGIDIQADNVQEGRKRLLKMLPVKLRKQAYKILLKNIVQGDFLKPETIWFLSEDAAIQGNLL